MKKILYLIGQFTWGFLMTLMGFFVFLFVLIFKKPHWIHKNGYGLIVEFGGDWGGLNLGLFSFCGSYVAGFDLTQFDDDIDKFNYYYALNNEGWFDHTRRHEFGHSMQNLILGPLCPFIILIPSAIRYHYQNWRTRKGLKNKPYDAIWFEAWATNWGDKVITKIEEELERKELIKAKKEKGYRNE